MTGPRSLGAMAALFSALICFAGCASSQNNLSKGSSGAAGYAGAYDGGTDGPSFGGTGGTGSAGTGGTSGTGGTAGTGGTSGSSGAGGTAGGGGVDGGADSSTGGAAGSTDAGSDSSSDGASGSAGSSSGGSAGSDGGIVGPENTCPGSAITLSGSGSTPRTGSVSGDNTNLTDNASGSCSSQGGGNDAVYSLTPDISGAANITLTSTFNASLYVRTACSDANSEVKCATETSFGTDSVSFSMQANTTYYVFVDGTQPGQVGSFQLNVTVTPTGPEDSCPGKSVSFTGSATQETATVQGNTSADSNSTSGSCVGTNQNDAVYAFTPDISGVMNVLLQAPNFDSGLYIRTTCASTNSELACSDNGGYGENESATVQVTAGTTYYVFVDGFDDGANDNNGAFTLTASVAQPGPEDVCPGKSVTLTSSGSGETATVQGNTAFDTDSTQGSCVGAGQNDAVYAFTPSMSGTMNVVLQDPGFDGGLYVRTTCASTSTEVACSDNALLGIDETATFSVTANTTYYVFVDAYSGSGPFTLTVTVQ